MSKVPERLKLAVSNVPAVYADEIPDEEWKWIKTQFPDDYATAQGQIKAHAKALAAQEADEKKTESAPTAPEKAADSAGGKK